MSRKPRALAVTRFFRRQAFQSPTPRTFFQGSGDAVGSSQMTRPYPVNRALFLTPGSQGNGQDAALSRWSWDLAARINAQAVQFVAEETKAGAAFVDL